MSLNQNLLKEVSQLDYQELQELSTRVKVMISLHHPSTHVAVTGNGKHSDSSMFVLACLCSFLDSKGIGQAQRQLRRSHMFSSFCDKVPKVLNYLYNLDKIEQSALLAIGFDMLYRYLSQWDESPINGPRMMACLHLLPSCLDSAFPGYREAGMLRMVVAGKRRSV